MSGCLWSAALLKFLVGRVWNFYFPSLPVQQDTGQCKACGLGWFTFGLGLFCLKADILHSSSNAFLASLLFRGGVCTCNWLLYAWLLTAAERKDCPVGGGLGRAGSCKEWECGEKGRPVCRDLPWHKDGMNIERTGILRMCYMTCLSSHNTLVCVMDIVLK